MTENYFITACCKIKSETISVNDNIVLKASETLLPTEFLKEAYKQLQLNYPKFYKMDNLCKLGFIASEMLLKSNDVIKKYKNDDIALVFSNSTSSIDIDTTHQISISDVNNFFPSPSVFVYTLPNILIGEIAIRNSIKGENTFFIFEKFDAQFMTSYVELLLNEAKAKCCIVGWVEYSSNNYEAILYSVEKKQENTNTIHSVESVNQIFK